MGISQGSYIGKNLLPLKNYDTMTVEDILIKAPNPLTATVGNTITLQFETKPAGQPIDVKINGQYSLNAGSSPLEFPYTPTQIGKATILATAKNTPGLSKSFEINIT